VKKMTTTEDLEGLYEQIEATEPLPDDRKTLEKQNLRAAVRSGATLPPRLTEYVMRNHTNYETLALEIKADALLRDLDGERPNEQADKARRQLKARAHNLAQRLIRDAYGEEK
jgi:hypothetical protein